jgi:hypothetical protein
VSACGHSSAFLPAVRNVVRFVALNAAVSGLVVKGNHVEKPEEEKWSLTKRALWVLTYQKRQTTMMSKLKTGKISLMTKIKAM